jgi:hypothetical protein
MADPADYTPPTPVRVNKVTLENVKEFFVDYIRVSWEPQAGREIADM